MSSVISRRKTLYHIRIPISTAVLTVLILDLGGVNQLLSPVRQAFPAVHRAPENHAALGVVPVPLGFCKRTLISLHQVLVQLRDVLVELLLCHRAFGPLDLPGDDPAVVELRELPHLVPLLFADECGGVRLAAVPKGLILCGLDCEHLRGGGRVT